MSKTITINNLTSRVRTISFRNSQDPYVMYHPDAEELSNGRLEELFAEWQSSRSGNDSPEETEEFEVFLTWLEDEKGFTYLAVTDEMYCFN